MSSVLVGMFDSRTQAEAAKARLMSAGFAESSLSLTGSGAGSSGGMSGSSGSNDTMASEEPHHEGAIARFFDRLFGEGEQDHPERASYSEHYSEAFNRGSYGLTVTTADEAEMERAERILNECGAVDIDQKAEQWRKEGWTGGGESRAESAIGAGVAGLEAGSKQKLQEVEEELKVGKRAVARGGVRIFTRMTETPVEETVRLREERADVQRRQVDRPATEADLAAFKEGSIDVREMSEEAVVNKSARVVGEVEIGKTATEREEVVRDTVRKTKVEVEKLGGGTDREARSMREPVLSDTGSREVGSGESATGQSVRQAVGDHPVGTGVGAAAGGIAAGAAAGSVAGPVGTAVGAAAGAVAGGLAGKGVAENVNPDENATEKKRI